MSAYALSAGAHRGPGIGSPGPGVPGSDKQPGVDAGNGTWPSPKAVWSLNLHAITAAVKAFFIEIIFSCKSKNRFFFFFGFHFCIFKTGFLCVDFAVLKLVL